VDLTTRGRTLGFSFAAGVNLYATVAILGLAARYGWVSLPPQFQVFNHDLVIGAAIVLYVIEFFADKIEQPGIRKQLFRKRRRVLVLRTLDALNRVDQ